MSLELLSNIDISKDIIQDGEYYCDATCKGLPKQQSAGYLKQVSYNDGTDTIFVMQTFRGLRNYGDKVLKAYERFAFPKESKLFNANGLDWMERRPGIYLQAL